MTSNEREALRTQFGTLKSLLRSDPDNAALLRNCAQLAVELHDYSEALMLASAALQAAPGDPQAMFHRASALIGCKRYADAAACLNALQAQGLTEPALAFNRALCHYMLNEFAGVSAQLQPLIKSGQTTSDVLRLAVSSLHHLGQMDTAIALADAHPRAGEDGATAGVYALAYLDAGRAADAAKFAAQALAKNPDSVDGLVVHGTLALAKMQTGSAETTLRRVTELAADNGRAWIGLGSIALLAQDFPRAREMLERGVKAMPAHVGSWHVLGWTHLVEGNLDLAEQSFQQALTLERNFAETHGALAAVYAMRGRLREARAELAIAEKLDRAGLAAKFATIVLEAQSGNRAAANAVMRATVEALIPRVGVRAGRILAAALQPVDPTRH
jgi:tetratricopeptide (TPR) repeat protein